MSRQFWTEALAWSVADGTAIASSTTETIIFPDVTPGANYMQDGRVLRLEASGKLSTTSTPTIRFRLRWGGVAGTLLADSGTITNASGVTNVPWFITLTIHTRTNGSSGTVFAMGQAMVYGGAAPTVGSATGAPAVAPMTVGGITAPATATVDLTAASALSLTATWGTNSASNTLTGHNYLLTSTN